MLTLLIGILLTGCGLYDKEYSAIEDYPVTAEDTDKASNIIHNYYEMQAAVLNIIHQHQGEGTITFESYEGDVSTDLQNLCWELRTGDAFCVYGVSEIDYELEHIVSLDSANISVTYSRSGEVLDTIRFLSYSTDLSGYIMDAVDNFSSQLIVLINNCSLDQDGIADMVRSVYEENPTIALAAPVVTVDMYSGNGMQRLFDIEFSYGDEISDLQFKKETVLQKVTSIAEQSLNEDDAASVMNVIQVISSQCRYQDDFVGNSLYSCLITCEANSQGLALSLLSICKQMDIPCETVNGYLNQKEHWWNIVQIDGDYYHIDLARCIEEGIETGAFHTDVEMWKEYRWDTSKHPECVGKLTYRDLTESV